jgi:signal transduction histidine kinase
VRNLVHTATLALEALKTGKVGIGGATGGVLDRSLTGITKLINAAVGEVRVVAGMPSLSQNTSLALFILEAEESAALDVKNHDCTLVVAAVDPTLGIDVDRGMLLGAVINLLQNAFKFTEHKTSVELTAYALGNRVKIDVADHCGGLPPNFAQEMFKPFKQGNYYRAGLGLGLSIARRSIEANQGNLSVRDIPGMGCVFTIDLPRHSLARQ